MSTPSVSDAKGRRYYPVRVKEKTPLGWGARFRESVKARGMNLAQVAEAVGCSESAVRSWTNGTRDINLSDYLRLCAAAKIDPAIILFAGKGGEQFFVISRAWGLATPEQKRYFETLARGVLSEHGIEVDRLANGKGFHR